MQKAVLEPTQCKRQFWDHEEGPNGFRKETETYHSDSWLSLQPSIPDAPVVYLSNLGTERRRKICLEHTKASNVK